MKFKDPMEVIARHAIACVIIAFHKNNLVVWSPDSFVLKILLMFYQCCYIWPKDLSFTVNILKLFV